MEKMDNNFQDKIDEYLLHGDRMSEENKAKFLQEIEQDVDKKEQFELTRNIKTVIASREDKLKVMADFKKQYANERITTAFCLTGTDNASLYITNPTQICKKTKSNRSKIWWWVSGMAALFVIVFFVIRPQFMDESVPMYQGTPDELYRGGDDVFNNAQPMVIDTIENDIISTDSIIHLREHKNE